MTTDPPPPVPTPPTCAAGTCGRIARWCITGENAGGEEVYRGHACDAALHQATTRQQAWQEYNVVIVKLRRLDKGTM